MPLLLQRRPPADDWSAAWGCSPALPYGPTAPVALARNTVRLVVHATAGGKRVRIRLSNAYGRTPLVVAGARIALSRGGAAIRSGTDRVLTFSGAPTAVVPPGAPALSDPMALDLPAGAAVAVSLVFAAVPERRAVHYNATEAAFLADGDAAGSPDLARSRPAPYAPFLVGVDVAGGGARGTIVALGDSITDGGRRRWPALLAARLRAAGKPYGLLNAGISGNRILSEAEDPVGQMFGVSALARLERDVLAQAGVRYVVLYEGINDIGNPGETGRLAPRTRPEEVIAGMKQIVARVHARALPIYGATLTPFEGTTIPGYYDPDKDAVRQAVNRWIRTSGAFDGVIDFEKALRDPAHPTRLRPAYDSGDHLHPSDAGERALADAVPPGWFR